MTGAPEPGNVRARRSGSAAAWLATAAWMAVVAVVSLVPARGPHVEVLLGADKWAHLALYAILGGLVGRAARRSGASRSAAWLLALAIAGAWGAALEGLQAGVGRNASLADGVADLVGAALGGGAVVRLTNPNEGAR